MPSGPNQAMETTGTAFPIPIPDALPEDGLLPQLQTEATVIGAAFDSVSDAITALSPSGGGTLADPGANGIVVRTLAGATTARSMANATAGITWTNANGVSGNPTPVLANDLAALEGLSLTGFAKRTGTDAWSLVGASAVGENLLTATNPSAISFPKIGADNSVSFRTPSQVLSDIGAQGSGNYLVDPGGNGIVVRTSLNTTINRSIVGTANQVSVANGDGVSGNPTISIPSNAQLSIAKITNLTTNGPVYLSGSDGTLNSEAVLNSVRGGTGVNNAGTITNGSNITFIGGGTFHLAGFDLTVPATGTVAEGAATLTVSTINTVSSANHTHAISSSSNPGAAASILASNSSGGLTVIDLLATSNLYVKDTSTGWKATTSTIITPVTGNTISSTSFSSGLLGWRIYDIGNAEFANVDVRGAIRSSVLLYNAVLATNGSQIVVKSAAKLKADIAIGASPTYGSTTVTVDVVDQDGLSHAASQLFVVGDVLRLKDGLAGDTWFTTTAVSDQTTFWRYTAVIQAGSNNTTYRAGLGVLDYGMSGQGFIVQTADQANSPYLQMATHNAAFTSGNSAGTLTVFPQLRIGNLNGFFSSYSSDIYGIAAGQQASGKSWFSLDPTNGFRIGNNTTTFAQVDAAGNASFVGLIASGATLGGFNIGTDYIRDAANSFGLASTVTGGDDVRFWAGDTFANRATAPFRVTEAGAAIMTNVTATGSFTLNAGSITGVLNMSGSGGAIAIGTTPPTSASAGTGIWIDRNGFYSLSSGAYQVQIGAGGSVQFSLAASTGVSWSNASASPIGINGSELGGLTILTTGVQGTIANPAARYALNVFTQSGGASTNLLINSSSTASNFQFYNSTGTLTGMTIGANSTPNAMLDVRGTAAITDNVFLSSGKKIDWNSGDVTITHSSDALAFAGAANGYSFDNNLTVSNTTNGGSVGLGYSSIGAEGGNYPQVGSNWYVTPGVGSVSKFKAGDYANRIFFDSGKFVFQNDSANGGGSANGTITWTTLVTINQNGGLVIGSPTGGNKGAGSINAVTVWRNGTSLDSVFEPDYKLLSIDAMGEFIKINHHLPTIPTSEVNQNGSTNLGALEDRLWETTENHALYILQLNDRIKSLEAKVADLEKRRN